MKRCERLATTAVYDTQIKKAEVPSDDIRNAMTCRSHHTALSWSSVYGLIVSDQWVLHRNSSLRRTVSQRVSEQSFAGNAITTWLLVQHQDLFDSSSGADDKSRVGRRKKRKAVQENWQYIQSGWKTETNTLFCAPYGSRLTACSRLHSI